MCQRPEILSLMLEIWISNLSAWEFSAEFCQSSCQTNRTANNKIKTSAIWFTLVAPVTFDGIFCLFYFFGSAGKLKSEIWASSCRAVWRAIKSNYIWICHKLKAESRKPHRSPSHSIAGFIKVSFVAVDARRFQHQHHHSAHDFWFWKRSDLQNIPNVAHTQCGPRSTAHSSGSCFGGWEAGECMWVT